MIESNEPTGSGDEKSMPALTLFVTGNAPRSHRARANLAEALRRVDNPRLETLEVDLFKQPAYSLEQAIFATPALLGRDADGGVAMLYGDLSEADKLDHFIQSLVASSG